MARHTTFSHGKEGEFMAEYIEVGFTALRDPEQANFSRLYRCISKKPALLWLMKLRWLKIWANCLPIK